MTILIIISAAPLLQGCAHGFTERKAPWVARHDQYRNVGLKRTTQTHQAHGRVSVDMFCGNAQVSAMNDQTEDGARQASERRRTSHCQGRD